MGFGIKTPEFGSQCTEVSYTGVKLNKIMWNLAGPLKSVSYSGGFLIAGFLIPGFYCICKDVFQI